MTDAERPAAAEATGAAEQAPPAAVIEPSLLDRIPIGVLVYRHDALLYANRHFLELTGYDDLDALEAAGGLNTLFAEPGADALAESGGAQALSIMTRRGDTLPVEGRLFTVPWNGASALALILTNGERGRPPAQQNSRSPPPRTNRELNARRQARGAESRRQPKPNSSPRSATRSARRSTP